MRRGRRIGALIALIICGAGRLQGASLETAATIRVRVIAAVGPSVHPLVELTSTDTTPLTLTAEIGDPDGLATFRNVPPGRYRLAVRALGFRDALADLDARPATTYEFEALLAHTTQANTESSLRVARTEPVGTFQVFDRQLIETFPAEDVLWSIVETAAATAIVDQISDGGLRVGAAGFVGGPGGSWRDTAIAFGSLDVTDPARPGTALMRANHAPAEALIVSTSMLPASMAGPGLVLTLMPKAPATVWRGGAMIGAFPSRLQADTARAGAPPIARVTMHRDMSVELGGPLGARAGLFVSSRLISADRIERDDATRLHSSVGSLSANTIVSAGPQGRLQFVGTLDRTSSPYAGRARFANRDARETDTFMSVHATSDRWTHAGTVWTTSAGFAQGVLDPSLDRARSTSVASVERLRDGSVPALFDPFPGTRRRVSAQLDVEPLLAIFGPRHSIATGVRVGRNTAVTRAAPSPAVAELVGGIAARLWDYGYVGPETRWASTELAAYVTDGITLPARVRVDAGARVELSRGSARDAAARVSWLSMAPRLGIRWQPDVSGRFALVVGYSRYAHALPLDYFAFGDPAAATGRVYRWNDQNGDRVFQAGERGVQVASVGPCCAGGAPNRIDPDLQRPLTDELVVSVDGRVGRWSARLTGVARRGRHLVASVNTLDPASYVLKYIPDLGADFLGPSDDRPLPVYDRDPASFGQDRYILTNPEGPDTRYQGIELTIERGGTGRWRTRVDGTAYRGDVVGANRGFHVFENDPGIVGEVFEDPNAATYARGRGFFDRGYVLKWWNSYRAPKDYLVSAVLRYQDGQPFARMVVVPDLHQGPEVIHAYSRGRTRFTFTLTLDAHLEKNVHVGRARVGGILEVFNLLNTSEEVEEDVLTTPAFRTSTAVQPPRAVRVALRLGF